MLINVLRAQYVNSRGGYDKGRQSVRQENIIISMGLAKGAKASQYC